MIDSDHLNGSMRKNHIVDYFLVDISHESINDTTANKKPKAFPHQHKSTHRINPSTAESFDEVSSDVANEVPLQKEAYYTDVILDSGVHCECVLIALRLGIW